MQRMTIASEEARRAIAHSVMMAPIGSRVSIGPAIKTRDQEELFHSMLNDIAKQASYLGSSWDVESWKRLIVDAWSKEDADMPRGRVIPALDGDGIVQLGIQTRSLSKERYSSLIEFTRAWCADNGVVTR